MFWHFEKSRDGVVTGRRNAFLGTEVAAIAHYKSAPRNNEAALNKTPIIGRRLTFGRCFRTSTDERAVIELNIRKGRNILRETEASRN